MTAPTTALHADAAWLDAQREELARDAENAGRARWPLHDVTRALLPLAICLSFTEEHGASFIRRAYAAGRAALSSAELSAYLLGRSLGPAELVPEEFLPLFEAGREVAMGEALERMEPLRRVA